MIISNFFFNPFSSDVISPTYITLCSWDNEIKEKITLRRELCKKVIIGWGDLWDEHCRLRKEVKELVSLIFGERLSRKQIQILMEVRESSGLW